MCWLKWQHDEHRLLLTGAAFLERALLCRLSMPSTQAWHRHA